MKLPLKITFCFTLTALILAAQISPCYGKLPTNSAEILKRSRLKSLDGIPVLHLEGSGYEIGFQHGVLLKEKVRKATRQILGYFPKKIKVPILGKLFFNFILDRSYGKMSPSIPQEYKDEMRGLADGSGVSLKNIHRVHTIPELYSTLCANGVFFGKATRDGRLYHLRNLDWNREIGIQDYLCLFAVRKTGAIPFVNIGYVSFIGSISGMNNEGISVGQIGSETRDYTLKGTPMPLLLRQVLEKSARLEDAVQIILGAKRTIGCNYVFADAKNKSACAIETTARHTAVFFENDPGEKVSPFALQVENAVIRSDFAVDPVIRNLQTCAAGNPKKSGLEDPRGTSAYDKRYLGQADFAKAHFGTMDSDSMMELARVIAPGSNVQSVIYGFPEFWVATAKGNARAVDSGYSQFTLAELLERK